MHVEWRYVVEEELHRKTWFHRGEYIVYNVVETMEQAEKKAKEWSEVLKNPIRITKRPIFVAD